MCRLVSAMEYNQGLFRAKTCNMLNDLLGLGGGGGYLHQNNCHNACKSPLEKRIKNRGKSKTIVKFGERPVLGHF